MVVEKTKTAIIPSSRRGICACIGSRGMEKWGARVILTCVVGERNGTPFLVFSVGQTDYTGLMYGNDVLYILYTYIFYVGSPYTRVVCLSGAKKGGP